MAALHDALKTLSPTTASDLPTAHSLPGYLANCLKDTHVLVSSVPSPSGTPCPLPTDAALEVLQKEWKPVKLGSKENPMGFSVYKLQAKDGKGTWFARRSVHEELGFKKFRAGLQREFEIGVKRGNSVRGVGRERTADAQRCTLGQTEINYLTAQFPGPSAPRDFVTASLTSSAHPDDIAQPPSGFSSGTSTGTSDLPKPRQFTMISRPLRDHPEFAERQGYVRGQFESVEFIREIPAYCHPPINRRSTEEAMKRVQSVPNVLRLQEEEETKVVGRKRGRTITFADGSVPGGSDVALSIKSATEAAHPEQNPVEWIMITRSDPGGSVPRWMVERGTPGGIVKDAEKFLDWAANQEGLEEEYPEEAEYMETMEGEKLADSDSIKAGVVPGQQIQQESKQRPAEEGESSTGAGGEGLLSSAVSAVSAGVSMLTPSIITSSSSSPANGETTPNPSTVGDTPPSTVKEDPDTDADYSDDDAGSIASFATARSNDPDNISINSEVSSSTPSGAHAPSTHEEKALARLLREKAKLAEKLERQRSRERKKRSKDDEREQKLLEKHMREVEKREARYNKEIEKAKKREEKRKKSKETKQNREVEELKKVVEGLTRENLALREKVEELEGRGRRSEKEEAEVDGVADV